MEFVDTDEMVETAAGRSVAGIFAKDGEEHFRELERRAVAEASGRDSCVIATGGGAVLDPGNMRALRRNGIIVNLDAPGEVLQERIGGSGARPLLGNAGLRSYLDERKCYYSVCDHRIETGELDIDGVAGEVCRIAGLPIIRICACISGADATAGVLHAARNGASMAELRLDLMDKTDIEALVRGSPLPVIATDRKNPDNVRKAMLAGCGFVDVDFDCPEKDELIQLAAGSGCRSIVSVHDFEGVPGAVPDKGGADFLKIAATLNSTDDLKRLVELHGRRDDIIIASMGPLGGLLRVFGPMLGSYLTYCSVGKPTATGQLDLRAMNEIFRGMKLR
jgi:shikimate kinase